ncbi:MAG: hypothetical protein ABR592_13710 [Nitriliruptorales bacterium]
MQSWSSQSARVRDLRKELKELEREEPGEKRAERLADFARRAHEERALNKAMHVAQLCLEEDPRAPTLLVAAYTREEAAEDLLRALSELANLGRWLGRDDLVEIARGRARTLAPDWLDESAGGERRRRLRALASMFGDEFAEHLQGDVPR